jgi:undecaprenyl diphosphate synthase
VAIIMDGSGRWATERGLVRSAGHRAGVEAVRRAVRAAPGLGIGALTLHAFSSDNWQRPEDEVQELFCIFRDYIAGDSRDWAKRGVRLSVFGRRDRLPPDLGAAIRAAEAATRAGRALHLRLGIDYSGRYAILRAAAGWTSSGTASPEEFSRRLAKLDRAEAPGVDPPVPEVDLLIRTGGEQRLSDFLLWEIAYAELVFTKRLWPDFEEADLEAAIHEFHSRQRRFGRIPVAAAS